MEKFVIHGGQALQGEVRPGGNKNAALPLLAASLLTDEPVRFRNVPRIRDVETMIALIAETGADVTWEAPNTVVIEAKNIGGDRLNHSLCRKIRASILLAGPMLARCGNLTLPPPGGDVIGRRRVDTHFHVLSALGADISIDHEYLLETTGLTGQEIVLDEPSVTGTENALMAAVTARGTTVLHNVAREPHVRELAAFLAKAGARIDGIGSDTMVIEGVDRLSGLDHDIGPDYIEVGSFIGLAAATGGSITIKGVNPDDLRMARIIFRRLGVEFELGDDTVFVPSSQSLVVQDDAHGAVPKIDDGPWPAFPSDLMSIALVVATQCRGTVLFFEKMFESRLFFVDSLISMGARIVLCDPHRAVVAGPSSLIGAQIESPDIRAGMALILAGLCASGKTTIGNITQIDRGYERVEEKLRLLGASIERVSG